MGSNTKGCHDVDVAKVRLVAAKKRAEITTQLFDSVAQTLGFVQSAAKQLLAGLWKTLSDSASKMMELAQSRVVCFHHEVMEARKDLVSVKQKWEGSGVDSESGTQSHNREEKQDYLSAKTLLPNVLERNLRHLFWIRRRRWSQCQFEQ